MNTKRNVPTALPSTAIRLLRDRRLIKRGGGHTSNRCTSMFEVAEVLGKLTCDLLPASLVVGCSWLTAQLGRLLYTRY